MFLKVHSLFFFQPTENQLTCLCKHPLCDHNTCTIQWDPGTNLDIVGGGACIVEYDYNPLIDEARVFQRCEHGVFALAACREKAIQVFDDGDIHICCYEDGCNTLELLEEVATAEPPDG